MLKAGSRVLLFLPLVETASSSMLAIVFKIEVCWLYNIKHQIAKHRHFSPSEGCSTFIAQALTNACLLL